MFILIIIHNHFQFNDSSEIDANFSIFRAEYLRFQFLVQLCGTGNQAYDGTRNIGHNYFCYHLAKFHGKNSKITPIRIFTVPQICVYVKYRTRLK